MPVYFQSTKTAFNNKVKVTLVPVIYIPLCTFTFKFSCVFPKLGTVHINIHATPATAMFKCGCVLVQFQHSISDHRGIRIFKLLWLFPFPPKAVRAALCHWWPWKWCDTGNAVGFLTCLGSVWVSLDRLYRLWFGPTVILAGRKHMDRLAQFVTEDTQTFGGETERHKKKIPWDSVKQE